MAYDIQLNLPEGWQKEAKEYVDEESGVEVSHIEAHLIDGKKKEEEGMIDIYVGEMPEDTDAEEQAFSNYVDMIGFSDDDPDDYNPIFKIKFNGKNAFGFDGLCENDAPMRLLTQEVKKGVLAVMCLAGKDEKTLDEVQSLVERNLRVKGGIE